MSDSQLPPISEQIAKVTASLAQWVRHGFKTVPDDVHAERLGLCYTCEHWNQNAFAGMGRCMKCGCSSAKTALPWEKCPVGKWGPWEDPALTTPPRHGPR